MTMKMENKAKNYRINLENCLNEIREQNEMFRPKVNIPIDELVECFYAMQKALIYPTPLIEPSEKMKGVIKSILSWINTENHTTYNIRKGFLIAGCTGRGKTLFMRTFSELLKFYRISYKSRSEVRMLAPKIVSARQLVREFSDEGHAVVIRYSNIASLCIDDIGSEPIVANSYGNKSSVVADIIDAREENRLFTFGTTNYARLSDVYDDRTISRMSSVFNIELFDGDKDLRRL